MSNNDHTPEIVTTFPGCLCDWYGPDLDTARLCGCPDCADARTDDD